MYVKERFVLGDRAQDYLRSLVPPFGYNGFGELVFYRTYSRVRRDGGQEDWADCVIRVVEGTMSIRKDWYVKNWIAWDEAAWQEYATRFAVALFLMQWMPPGRGLWAMGTDFVYERGGMALNNCASTIFGDDLGDDLAWMMDCLMQGVGTGFRPTRNDAMELHVPHGVEDYVVPDSREGWCECSRAIVDSYLKPRRARVRPIYDLVRQAGEPIRGFGGVASGPEPLRHFHGQLVSFLERYRERREYDSVRLKADCGNACGACVVSGNVRRSAEIMLGAITDPVFKDLKDYDRFPERVEFGHLSNNSVELIEDSDFELLGEIARRVIKNGEPGYINRQNFKYARIGKKMRGLKKDNGILINPCGESILANREVCTQAETLPTVCLDSEEWLQSCEYATFYASTVTLIPTNQPSTNRIIAKNRRITVGIIDYTGWKHEHGVNRVTKWMRQGYDRVRSTNRWANEEAGVPLAIRVTTMKPGGTSPKLPGRTSGIQHPNFHHMIRRIRVAKNSPIHPLLAEAGIPYEEDLRDRYTDVFEYPILQGPAKPADQVTIWEQAMNLVLVQREWADNAVASTLAFRPMWPLVQHIERDFQDQLAQYVGLVTACHLLWSSETEYVVPERYRVVCRRDAEGELVSVDVHEYDPRHEENDIEAVLSAIAPLTKSVSLLPHSPKGAYPQMPEEGISLAEYERRLAEIRPIDWSRLSGSDGIDERYCQADSCELPR